MINIIAMTDNKLSKNEEGVISIIVTMVFIIVVGLIVLGFGEISRNQSRQTLDNQLSTASYYAAQSGINTILNNIIGGGASSWNKCTNTPGITFNGNSGSVIKCATWTNSVSSLIWDDISVNKSQTAYVPLTGNYTLNIKWHNLGSNASSVSSSCNGSLYDANTYLAKCPEAGVLRLNISSGLGSCGSAPDSRICLSNSSQTYFLIPKAGAVPGSPVVFSPSSAAVKFNSSDLSFSISCTNSNPCTWINMRSIYSDSSVTITAKNSAGSSLQFVNSQAQIDVTAVTNSVARRVVAQANIAQNIPNGSSDFSIVSTKSLCKNVTVSDASGNALSHPLDSALNPAPTSGPCVSY